MLKNKKIVIFDGFEENFFFKGYVRLLKAKKLHSNDK